MHDQIKEVKRIRFVLRSGATFLSVREPIRVIHTHTKNLVDSPSDED